MKTTIVANYTTSELFALANVLRKELHVSQKEAFAKARLQLENKAVAPVKKGRGHYVRTAEWRAKHGEQMKAFWAGWRANK